MTRTKNNPTLELALDGALSIFERVMGRKRATTKDGPTPPNPENAMAFQPVIDTAEIDILFTMNGANLQNSFYAALVGGYTLVDLENLAAIIDAQVQGTWKTQLPIECFYARTEVRGLAVENDLVVSDNTNAGVGVDPSATLPNSVTFAVKKQSGLSGRSARGRTYWPAIPSAKTTAVNENVLGTAYVDAVVAAVDSIRTAIVGEPLWTPVLVSRFSGGVQRPAGVLFPWISCVAVDEVVDTQRGRLPKL